MGGTALEQRVVRAVEQNTQQWHSSKVTSIRSSDTGPRPQS